MAGAMPWLFALLGVGALVVVLLSLWRSFRAAFGVSDVHAMAGVSHTEQRAALLDEKHSLLQSIKDLEFERDVGKISDADFKRLNGTLRTRAREVFRLLDEDLGPFRQQAEDLVAKRLKKEKVASPYRSPAAEAPAGAPSTPPVEAEARVRCDACTTDNDSDATFCKKCGAKLAGDEPAEGDASGQGAEASSGEAPEGDGGEGPSGEAAAGGEPTASDEDEEGGAR